MYDNGLRTGLDSLSPRLYWTQDEAQIGLVAPFTPGEYIYRFTIGWEESGLTASYGIKVVLTGERSAYDEALQAVWDRYEDVLSVSFQGVETYSGTEQAEVYYIFEVELPSGVVQAAVSQRTGRLLPDGG